MHHILLLRRLISAAILATFCSHALARPAAEAQLVPPPTVTCGTCREGEDGESIKWCQRCTMAPAHCTLKFSVACHAKVDKFCIGNVMDCVHDRDDDCDDDEEGDGGEGDDGEGDGGDGDE